MIRFALALGAASVLGAPAAANVTSSNGRWEASMDRVAIGVGEHAALILSIRGVHTDGCPKLDGVILEMPQHGHGTDYKPQFVSSGLCKWRLSNVTPTMRGVWRLRLVLKYGDETSVADYEVVAQ